MGIYSQSTNSVDPGSFFFDSLGELATIQQTKGAHRAVGNCGFGRWAAM